MQDLPEAIVAVMALFEKRGPAAIANFLADSIELKPPTYWKTWTGKPAVSRLLGFAAQNIDDLRYVRQFRQGDHYVLQFEASVSGMALSGVDVLALDGAGMIKEFEIFARPPNSVLELSKRMHASLQRDPFFASQQANAPSAQAK